MDTNLICYATRCIYNNSDYCYANKISIDGRLAAGDSHAGARESTSARPAGKRTERGDVHDYGAGSARGLASRQNPAPDAD